MKRSTSRNSLRLGEARPLLGPEAGEEEQHGGFRRIENVLQDGQAVRIAPVQVVDDEHQGLPLAKSPEQLPKRSERPATEGLGVQVGRTVPAAVLQGLDLAEHGKDLSQGMGVGGQQGLEPIGRQGVQVLAERVHEAIQHLVGNILLRVAPAAQDQGPGRDPPDFAPELPQQVGLADARAAVQVDPAAGAVLERLEGIHEPFQFRDAAHEALAQERGGMGVRLLQPLHELLP